MALDTGIIWTDPWATWFGRAGIRLYIPDPDKTQSQVTATWEMYSYGVPGNKADPISWNIQVRNSAGTISASDYRETYAYKIPGTGTAVVTVLVETRYIVVPVYYSGQQGSTSVSVEAYVWTEAPDQQQVDRTFTPPARPFWPPDQMTPPTLAFTPPSTVLASFVAPNQGGAPITSYDVQYSLNSDMSTPSTVYSTGMSQLIDTLLPGNRYYFRVRATNSLGSGTWSSVAYVDVMSGPRIRVGGVYKSSVCYVKVGGIWKIAVPYSKVNGVWRNAGG